MRFYRQVLNSLLNQMTADATGVAVITGPVEATVIGNTLVQLISLGDIKDLHQGRQLVRNLKEIKEYQPQNMAAWDNIYSKFKKL